VDSKKKKEVLRDAILAYSHANNMPMDIGKRSWLDHLNGVKESDKIINYLNTQIAFTKRIIDGLLGENSNLPMKSNIFACDIDAIMEELLKKV